MKKKTDNLTHMYIELPGLNWHIPICSQWKCRISAVFSATVGVELSQMGWGVGEEIELSRGDD